MVQMREKRGLEREERFRKRKEWDIKNIKKGKQKWQTKERKGTNKACKDEGGIFDTCMHSYCHMYRFYTYMCTCFPTTA